ncbi:AIR synthase-related protein [Blautia sp.]|uniref:AIR synthase-related protein n=1 Tax=Blautia sp. TaxID=1955243 RepID=UPI00280AEB61|nr:AIR synthase-related protein [Blautia sp.]MED9883505.1 AIR synthase-related protein [Blautia sp.]
MRLGQKAMEALRAEVTGILKEGDELVIAGDIALGGTAFIVEKEKEFLRQYFSEGFLWDAWRGPSLYGVSRNMIEHQKTMEMDAFYSLGEGGVLAGLWKMAEASEIGLFADLRKIPVRQETIEICERFNLNPYKLLSEGSILVGTIKGEELVQYYSEQGIPAAVIGKAVKGNDRILRSGENVRYLERPSQDEITKFAWGEKWKNSGRIPGKKKETEEC